ncbi:MAG: MarR family winged helix-turn-helix transcriptional regulator [Kofleriaceae bacterium]
MTSRELSDHDYRVLAGFRHQLRCFTAFSETSARAVGIEPRQHQLLLALRGLPENTEPSVQILADQMVLRHHTVVELLDRLETAGLIRRERAVDDRRRSHIKLTARGAALLRKLADVHLDELRSLAPALLESLQAVLRTSTGKAA